LTEVLLNCAVAGGKRGRGNRGSVPLFFEIFNTDQGCQFPSEAFTSVLKTWNIKISMDGKGRYKDNIFIERLWRTLKYEKIYLKSYETGVELSQELASWFSYYNENRKHSSLDKQTPNEAYFRGLEKLHPAT